MLEHERETPGHADEDRDGGDVEFEDFPEPDEDLPMPHPDDLDSVPVSDSYSDQ